VLDIARGVPTRLTFGGGSDNPIWTADGKQIIYGSEQEGKKGIYSVPADASGAPELLLAVEGRPLPTSVTADGKTIVYTLYSSNAAPKIMAFTRGEQPRGVHDVAFAENNGQLSPDGKWLSYESTESGGQEVYVQPFPGPGAKVRISQRGGSWPRWSRDMKELFFWDGAAPVTGIMEVPIQAGATFQAEAPQRLFTMTSGTTWDVAPDKNHFLVEQAISLGSRGSTLAAVTNWFDELRRRAPAKK
jgi:hypothetical protein